MGIRRTLQTWKPDPHVIHEVHGALHQIKLWVDFISGLHDKCQRALNWLHFNVRSRMGFEMPVLHHVCFWPSAARP